MDTIHFTQPSWRQQIPTARQTRQDPATRRSLPRRTHQEEHPGYRRVFSSPSIRFQISAPTLSRVYMLCMSATFRRIGTRIASPAISRYTTDGSFSYLRSNTFSMPPSDLIDRHYPGQSDVLSSASAAQILAHPITSRKLPPAEGFLLCQIRAYSTTGTRTCQETQSTVLAATCRTGSTPQGMGYSSKIDH